MPWFAPLLIPPTPELVFVKAPCATGANGLDGTGDFALARLAREPARGQARAGGAAISATDWEDDNRLDALATTTDLRQRCPEQPVMTRSGHRAR